MGFMRQIEDFILQANEAELQQIEQFIKIRRGQLETPAGIDNIGTLECPEGQIKLFEKCTDAPQTIFPATASVDPKQVVSAFLSKKAVENKPGLIFEKYPGQVVIFKSDRGWEVGMYSSVVKKYRSTVFVDHQKALETAKKEAKRLDTKVVEL